MDWLKKYFKENIIKLNDNIYIKFKDNSGKQIHINYTKCNYSNNNVIEITHFIDYIKVETKRKIISIFGEHSDIIFYTVKNYLNTIINFF